MSVRLLVSKGLTRAEAGIREGHEGAVYGRTHNKLSTWYIDTAGEYQWQILTKTSDFEMEVLLRERTSNMRTIGCNGCTSRHIKSRKHCSANNPVNLSDNQRTFVDEWLAPNIQDKAKGVYSLYDIGENRTKYPNKWTIDTVSGIFEDGYTSGQATIKLVE